VTKNKLHFGCGKNILSNYDNYDINPVNNKVQFIDLNILPLQFKCGYADEIKIEHVLEHLDCNKKAFLIELLRITKKGGIVKVKCPCEDNNLSHSKSNFVPGYFGWLLKNGYADDITVRCVKFSLARHLYRVFNKIRLLGIKEIQWEIKK
jgi:ubiquinone/menaquinone biosynthesis C-methylase UbiE